MLAKLQSVAVNGIDASMLQVEVDLSAGIPGMTIVGLPDAAVKEAKDRVKAAVNNSQFHFPFKKLTVNLAPAHIRKEGPIFDLPIAIGTLMASGVMPVDGIEDYALVGELSLEGVLRPIRGALSMAIAAKRDGKKFFILPQENAQEAALVNGIAVIPVKSLREAVDFILGNISIAPAQPKELDTITNHVCGDFSDVVGQEAAKRAILIAAAGGHNLLMVGPPGCGKTMMAQRIPSILTPMSFDEALETTQIYSVVDCLNNQLRLKSLRPFRAPHHTISEMGLVGGSARPRPGEVTLAHNGVLFLDELPEFKRNTLEVLRQPLESGVVTISRAQGSMTFPARFMLVASMNPCPCGFFGDSAHQCQCTSGQIERYVNRISGPLLDRIDLQVEVESLPVNQVVSKSEPLSSEEIKIKVNQAQKMQHERYLSIRIHRNSDMIPDHIKKYCALDKSSKQLLSSAIRQYGFSTRAYHRILKISRTIADIEQSGDILIEHIAEAIGYRILDRKLWMP